MAYVDDDDDGYVYAVWYDDGGELAYSLSSAIHSVKERGPSSRFRKFENCAEAMEWIFSMERVLPAKGHVLNYATYYKSGDLGGLGVILSINGVVVFECSRKVAASSDDELELKALLTGLTEAHLGGVGDLEVIGSNVCAAAKVKGLLKTSGEKERILLMDISSIVKTFRTFQLRLVTPMENATARWLARNII